MKKFLLLFMAVVMMISVSACGKDEKSDKKETTSTNSEETQSVDVNEILMSMRETQITFPQYTTASSHDENGKEIDSWQDVFSLSLYEDFDVKKVKSYAIAYSVAQTADEITVVELNSKSDADELKKQMKKRISDRITLFETYGPEEVVKLEDAKIISKGNVCVLIVCDEPEKASDAFKDAF